MDLDLSDLSAVLSLFDRNVQKLETNLSAYQQEVNAVRRSLFDNWSHVGCADSRIIPIHDGLLSSVSGINENIIKLNLHINLNRALSIFKNANGLTKIDGDSSEQQVDKQNHTNLNRNEKGEVNTTAQQVDLTPKSKEHQQNYEGDHTNLEENKQDEGDSTDKKADLMPNITEHEQIDEVNLSKHEENKKDEEDSTDDLVDFMPKSTEQPVQQETLIQNDKDSNKNVEEESILEQSSDLLQPAVAITGSNCKLLPPQGGRQMSSNETYDQLKKNISGFAKDSIVRATMMHLNIAENCIFVGKWSDDTIPIKKLLACQMSLEKLHRFPDFGETFAVYDAQEQIIPRVLINALTEGGGYDAYLLDYGEHIHLTGDEEIFELSPEVKALPAEAIRCYLPNRDISSMREFIYKNISLRILNINNKELVAELVEGTQSDDGSSEKRENSKEQGKLEAKSKQEPESDPMKCHQKLSASDMEMLENYETGTSNAVKAVLGFIPKDDKRLCRHYDPKLGGCFKGSNCRLVHEPFAPHGATKDTELVEQLPETVFESGLSRELGSIVRVLVTNIQSPIQFYVQYVDQLSPLVWSSNEIPESQRTFKRPPLVLDTVLALYSDDCYYRAQIIEVIEGMYKIFYVDYGNTEFVCLKSLAPCSNAISLKPHQAVNCFIEGVRLSSTVSHAKTVECVEFLKSKILNSEFDVLLASRLPDGYSIQFTDRWADLPKQMIQRKYVEPSTVHL